MQISTLTRASAGMLFLASIGMAVSVFWGLRQLQTPFVLNQNYFQLAQQISVDSRRLIENYLQSGDAVDLTRAQEYLAGDVTEGFQQLPEALQASMQPAVAALQQSLEVDLRAAGKLAGNLQGLLLQNEREFIDTLERLASYADQAPPDAGTAVTDYRRHIIEAGVLLARRGLARSRYFESFNPEQRQLIDRQSREMVSITTTIEALPLLGVWKEEEVNELEAMMGFASDEPERFELGEPIRSELTSLARRYRGELENTAALIAAGEQARKKVAAEMAALEAELTQGKSYLDGIKAEVERAVTVLIGTLLVLLFVTVIAGFLVQQRVVQGMGTVRAYLKHLRSGDFSRQMATSFRFEELQSLRQSANQLQQHMHRLVSEIRSEVQAVDTVSGGLDKVATVIDDSSQVQSQRTIEANTAIGELAESFRLVAGHALEASQTAVEGQTEARDSAQVMEGLEAAITELSDESRQGCEAAGRLQEDSQSIEAVLNVIVAIAEQTNLLALNAAIEAARAGDQGRGFAVVADEVRQLAQRTAESTREIRKIIEGLRVSSETVVVLMGSQQTRAQESVRYANEAAEKLKAVVTAIDRSSDLNTLIAQATEEQAASAVAVKEGVEEVHRHAQDAAAQTAEARDQSTHLARVSRNLNTLVERFQI